MTRTLTRHRARVTPTCLGRRRTPSRLDCRYGLSPRNFYGAIAQTGTVPNVAFIRNHTGGQNKTTGSTLNVVLAADVPAGRLLAMSFACDNSGTSSPDISSITTPGGESASWVRLGTFDSPSATGSNGVVGELWVILTTTTWVSASFTPQVTLDATRNAKSAVLAEFSGCTTTLRTATVTGTSATGTPTATSGGAFTIGDLVLGASGWETALAITGDSDTSNGTWSTVLSLATSGGLDQSNILAALQYKIVTGAATQTYNPTGTSTDAGVILSGLVPA